MLVIAYAIVCPMVIRFAVGHLNAGLVKVALTPSDVAATVTVANRELHGPWPQTLTQVAPGSYQLHVEALGYAPQSRLVTVTKGKVNMLDRLLLLPDPLKPKTVANTKCAGLVALPGTSQLLIHRDNDEAAELLAYDWKTRTLRSIFPKDAPFAVGTVRQIATMENSSQALAWIERGEQCIGVAIDLGQDPPLIRTDAKLVVKKPAPVFWDAANPKTLFIARDGYLSPVFAEWQPGATLSHPTMRWHGFGVGDGQLYALDKHYLLRRMTADGREIGTQTPPEPDSDHLEKARQLFGNRDFYRILPRDEDSFFFLDERGRLAQNRQPHLLAEDGVLGIKMYLVPDKPNRTLVWQGERAGVIDEPSAAKRPRAGQLEDGREIRWFFENGTAISAAYLLHDGSHALVLDDSRVLLFELFPGGNPDPREIIAVKPSTNIAYTEEIGTLFYIDARNGRCRALRLLPEDDTVELSATAVN